MSITNGYTDLATYKSHFGIGDNDDDASLERVIETVSRSIDEICWQRFFTSAADETRYYTAERVDVLDTVDRIISITTLKTDDDGDRTYENTWTATDYDLLPYNAALDSIPYHSIEITPEGDYSFPTIPKGVEIDGKFGWSSAPDGIVEACLLGSHLTQARRNSPYGVSGAAAVGGLTGVIQSIKQDPLIMDLLAPYMARF